MAYGLKKKIAKGISKVPVPEVFKSAKEVDEFQKKLANSIAAEFKSQKGAEE